VRGDITDLAALETLIDAHGVTTIIHLAALRCRSAARTRCAELR
jgi:nucleoside-diphosphate-sugar epimerase